MVPERIVFPKPQICSGCRKAYAYTGWKFPEDNVVVSLCHRCAPQWPLRKLEGKLSRAKPKFGLLAHTDFRPRSVAPLR